MCGCRDSNPRRKKFYRIGTTDFGCNGNESSTFVCELQKPLST